MRKENKNETVREETSMSQKGKEIERAKERQTGREGK